MLDLKIVNDIRTLDFNYYYPEMKKAPVDREDQRKHVSAEVRKLYGPPVEGDERLGSPDGAPDHYFGHHGNIYI